MARAMATAWRSPPDSELIGVVGGMFLVMPTSRMRRRGDLVHRALSMRLRKRGPLIGSRPRNRLRAIESCVTSAESW